MMQVLLEISDVTVIQIDGKYLKNLRFASDHFTSDFKTNLHMMIGELHRESLEVGLPVNMKKQRKCVFNQTLTEHVMSENETLETREIHIFRKNT